MLADAVVSHWGGLQYNEAVGKISGVSNNCALHLMTALLLRGWASLRGTNKFSLDQIQEVVSPTYLWVGLQHIASRPYMSSDDRIFGVYISIVQWRQI
eukprot:350508-Chlamydomonas_euryale.AAC.2